MKRSKQTLSHYRMVTANMGQLFPVCCVPVIPGDTFQHHTSALVRVSPLNTPVMHPVQVRLHSFFVPNRITWPVTESDGWENFITGGKDGLNTATPPQFTVPSATGTVTEYLGMSRPSSTMTTSANALPLRAFNAIYNEYYRDQDVISERVPGDNTVPNCAWEKDYFSVARPWSQKGPAITFPIGDKAPVATDVNNETSPLGIFDTNSGSYKQMTSSTATVQKSTGTTPAGDQLYADLSQAAQIDINAFRTGFALQRYQEARARYGSRFTEYLRYLGITPSDARLQRPEFLAGGTTRLQFSEVLQTTPNASDPTQGVGDLYGHGIAGARTMRYRKFFEEHGYVITVMSVRPKALYMECTHREWWKKTKEDYYQRELVHLGQQEVSAKELTVNADDESRSFGFTDRYDEYRTHPSQVSQDFRSTLSSWHLGRSLPSDVALNQAFIDCVPSKRIHQVTDNDVLWVMVNNHIVARRPIPKRSSPRIL